MTHTDSQRGFTLIELLVVMTIIATLAGLGIVGIPAYQRRTEKLACASQLQDIYKHLLLYEGDKGAMPSASGPAFPLAIFGPYMDKTVRNAQTFFCPARGHRPEGDLSNVTPDGIDYTGPDQKVQSGRRNALKSSMAMASDVVIIADKCPDASESTSEEQRRQNLPHQTKGIMVLYLGGGTEFIDAASFQDDITVIGPESTIEKLRGLVSGFGG